MKNCLDELYLQHNVNAPIWSDGDFSMHELIERLLELTGPADVRISTFSVTEVAVRTFSRLQEKGLIKSLKCLFDFSVKQHRLAVLFFASNIIPDIFLSKCHAKLILVENEIWKVAMVGSANFNYNDKKEIGIISTVDAIFNLFSNKYDEWVADSLKIEADGL